MEMLVSSFSGRGSNEDGWGMGRDEVEDVWWKNKGECDALCPEAEQE